MAYIFQVSENTHVCVCSCTGRFVTILVVCVTVLLTICNYFQELKNKWRSAEELRKTDNGHREKNSWKQRQKVEGDYEPKCNIQKGKRRDPPVLVSDLPYAVLGAFAKLRNATISYAMSVCPSVHPSARMERLDCHQTDFLKT